MKFKIGDRVKYISGAFGDTRINPLWGGKYKYISGIIIKINLPNALGFPYKVEWNNGCCNTYNPDDLELLIEQKFCKGDIIECISNKNNKINFTIGKKYIVLNESEKIKNGHYIVNVTNDRGNQSTCYSFRFRAVKIVNLKRNKCTCSYNNAITRLKMKGYCREYINDIINKYNIKI